MKRFKLFTEEDNPRIPRKKGQPLILKNTLTYTQMKIQRELFMVLDLKM